MEKIRDFLKQFGILCLAGVIGLSIVIYGLWGALVPEAATVEVIKAGSQESQRANRDSPLQDQITVDVAGSVENPGVYKLPSGSRVGDAIVAAGGLSENADRDWVAKTLNLAEEVKDGGKVYIPARNTERETPSQSNGKGVTLGESRSAKININHASLGELDSLSGIGEARAQAIIDNRPYSKIDELMSKAKIPESIYEKIKDSLSLY